MDAGCVATAQEVKARWAFSEMISTRFGQNYTDRGPERLRDLVARNASFDEVDQRDWPILVSMIEQFGRNKAFVDSVDSWGAPYFMCKEWRMSELLQTFTLPCFGQVSYPVFLTQCPNVKQPATFDMADPRFIAWSIPPNQAFYQREPIIIIRVGQPQQYMILDGYLRSILWFRSNTTKPLLAWLPV
jgi:hypothetical protein